MGEGPVILHGKFSTWLPWHQPFLHDLLRGLDAHFRNVVVCNRTENLERFGRPQIVPLKTRALLQPAAAVVVAAELGERFAPALLHGHFGWSGLRLLLLKRLLGVPLVTTFGGRDAGAQLRDPRMAPLYELLLAASDRILCVSGHLAEAVRAAGADAARVDVVHRGTDLAHFAFHERPARHKGPFRLLAVGRLVAKKGHEDALVALARLRAAGVEAHLTLVGRGPEGPALRQRAAELGLGDRVTLAGETDRDGLREQLRQADVLVHPSVTAPDGDVEGIPNVVVEAGATGLPVVATRHGGIPEAVVDGRTGLLVGEADPEALAHALLALSRSPEQRLALGKAAAQRAREQFDLRVQVDRHRSVYEGLIAEAAPRPVPLPDDFLERVHRAAGVKPRPWDHALARAAAAAAGSPDLPLLLGAAPRGRGDRLLEAPTAWPRPWRSAAELGLDLAARGPLRGALLGFRERSRRRARALDLHVLEYLRAGGALGAVPAERAALPLRDLAGEPAGPPGPWRRLRLRLAPAAEDGDDA